MFGYGLENVIGSIGDVGKSPFLVGGELVNEKDYTTDLQIKCPYYTVSDDIELKSQLAEMTPEQIEEFNHRSSQIEVGKHSYTYAKVDGYYRAEVNDFAINGEEYHIKDDAWTNGGTYTVVWKDGNDDYPDKAVGLSISDSEWAHHQRGVDIGKILDFIAQNPNRFSKFLDTYANESNCWGCFRKFHIEEVIREFMRMKTESELAKESAVQYPDETFLTEVVQRATAREVLDTHTREAKNLLTEYKNMENGKGNLDIIDD